jgi:hypothetical protein
MYGLYHIFFYISTVSQKKFADVRMPSIYTWMPGCSDAFYIYVDARMVRIHSTYTWIPGRSDVFYTNNIRSRVRQKDSAQILYALCRT